MNLSKKKGLKPKVSIIVPVYKVEKQLEGMLSSIENQTYTEYEVILVDDGSPDSCSSICDTWARKDRRFKVIHQDNMGVGKARNNGFMLSCGEYIIFLDADDEIEKNMIESLVKKIEEEHADFVCCGFQNVFTDRTEICIPRQDVLYDDDIIHALVFDIGFFTAIWNKLFKREAILTATGEMLPFEQNIYVGEDALWLSRVIKQCHKVACIEKPLYIWKRRKGSATHGDSAVHIDEKSLTVLDAYMLMAREICGVNERAYRKVLKRYLSLIRDCAVLAHDTGNFELKMVLRQRAEDDIKLYSPQNIKDIFFLCKYYFSFWLMIHEVNSTVVRKICKI